MKEARRAVASLRRMGAHELAEILGAAVVARESNEHEDPQTVEEYVQEALKGELSDFDERFGIADPSLDEILERHLGENRDLFVTIRPSQWVAFAAD